MGEKLAELQPTINLHFHPLHPLTLIVRRVNWYCDVCRTHYLARQFSYCCSECDFDACIKCGTEHSQKLIENWETIVNDYDEKKSEVRCEGCGNPISTVGGSALGCILCRYFLHKRCAELPPTINHHFHNFHLLTLIVRRVNWYCDMCRTHHPARHFSYCCSECEFDLCIKCGADHEEHSLKLIENWETIVNDHDEKKGEVRCEGCRDPISTVGGAAYGCILCRYFLHKACAELPPTINHHYHPLHPLTLTIHSYSIWYCDVCDNRQCLLKGFRYHCSRCKFDVCIKCGVIVLAQQAADSELKKEASIKLKHEGHPQHLLTLQLKPASFYCDACKTEEKDFFYQCDTCVFWIHKGCASLATTINIPHHHNHPLVLAYSLPERFYNYAYYCEFCDKRLLQNDWLYHCANCRYFAHIKCVLKAEQPSVSRDHADTSAAVVEEQGSDLLHFPMSYRFTDPLKLQYSGKASSDDDEDSVEVNHWRHDHPLKLNVEPQGKSMTDINSGDLIEVCYGCVRPLSFPYYSCSKDGCPFTLHKYCAQLPLTLKHQLHSDHTLDLVDIFGHDCFYECAGCHGHGNTFIYRCQTCSFHLCVSCAYLPNIIKHKTHKDPLIQVIDPQPRCKACDKVYSGMSYACKACDFQLDMHCATRTPQSFAHRYCKGHEILLTYPPVENHPEDFYCEICEIEMHPKQPLYHCRKNKNSFHLKCLSRIDYYANIWKEGTITVPYHKHPLTFVRRKKTPKYVCSKCNQDINGVLVLECRARVCNFNICYDCHLIN